jgi:serine/threonine-protein phosphatase 2A activator
MFNAEVLSKFPVVQHFPFGSLFSWDIDPNASKPQQSTHMANQPIATAVTSASSQPGGTAAPWAQSARMPGGSTSQPTAAPWAQATRMPGPQGPGILYARAPDRATPTITNKAHGGGAARSEEPKPTQVPLDLVPNLACVRPTGPRGTAGAQVSVTKAPWAK